MALSSDVISCEKAREEQISIEPRMQNGNRQEELCHHALNPHRCIEEPGELKHLSTEEEKKHRFLSSGERKEKPKPCAHRGYGLSRAGS